MAVTAVAAVSARVASVSDAKLTPGCRAGGRATAVAIERIKPRIRGEPDNGDLVDSRSEQNGGRARRVENSTGDPVAPLGRGRACRTVVIFAISVRDHHCDFYARRKPIVILIGGDAEAVIDMVVR